eukprot:g29423.t1
MSTLRDRLSRSDVKSRDAGRSRDQVRREMLEQQKESRRLMLERARELVTTAIDMDDLEEEVEDQQPGDGQAMLSNHNELGTTAMATGKENASGQRGKSKKEKDALVQAKFHQRRVRTARSFMYPSWLTPYDLPSDLGQSWYVCARPEGIRCLVVAHKGVTVSKKASGNRLHRFVSALPNGSDPTRTREGYTILDCIYHPKNKTYYALDLLCWSSFLYYDCDADFRFSWLSSKLAETTVDSLSAHNTYCIRIAPRTLCTVQGLQKAYPSQARNCHGFWQDGLLFYHRGSHYVLGPTPLALLWKDDRCSPYVVHTRDGHTKESEHFILLQLDEQYTVRELEGAVLGSFNPQLAAQVNAKPGDILRFSVSGFDTEAETPRVSGLKYCGRASQARILPDSWSKIQFQALARDGKGVDIHMLARHIAQTASQNSLSFSPSPSPSVPFTSAHLLATTSSDQSLSASSFSSFASSSSSSSSAISTSSSDFATFSAEDTRTEADEAAIRKARLDAYLLRQSQATVPHQQAVHNSLSSSPPSSSPGRCRGHKKGKKPGSGQSLMDPTLRGPNGGDNMEQD